MKGAHLVHSKDLQIAVPVRENVQKNKFAVQMDVWGVQVGHLASLYPQVRICSDW